MTMLQLVSLASSIASFVLAVVAIWLALYHKKQSEITDEKVRDLLLQVKTDANVITSYALPELSKINDAMVDHVFYPKNREVKTSAASAEWVGPAHGGSDHANAPDAVGMELEASVHQFEAIVEEIRNGDSFNSKQRDKAMRIARAVKQNGHSNDPTFIVSLEALLDSFAAADQNKFVDMIDDQFPEITTTEPGFNQTMLISLGLRMLESDAPDDGVISRFEKHIELASSLDTIQHGLDAQLVYAYSRGEKRRIEELLAEVEKLDPHKIASIAENIERRRDPRTIAKRPTEKIKKVASKYDSFAQEYLGRLRSMHE